MEKLSCSKRAMRKSDVICVLNVQQLWGSGSAVAVAIGKHHLYVWRRPVFTFGGVGGPRVPALPG